MNGIPDGLLLFVKKDGVRELYKVQVKESSEDEWKELDMEIEDIRDVYMIKFNTGQHKKQYDFRILALMRSQKNQPPYLLFEAKEQFVYSMYYHKHNITIKNDS